MCGIIGICSDKDISKDLYYGLYSLQHRGQESCGISVWNGEKIDYHRGMGLVSDVLKKEELDKLKGNIGIGHVRYSTVGGSHISNCQPLVGACRGKKLSIAHNGNLINNLYLRQTLEEEGFIFQTSIDSEVILYILARYYKGDIIESIKITMDYIKGAYSLVVLSEEGLVAVRDPHGFRPLVLGRRGDEYIVSSESGSIDILGGEVIRDIEPGEIVLIKDGNLKSYNYRNNYKEMKKICIFEHIYFARNDAVIDSVNVYDFRVKSGEIIAREDDVDADIVVPVPDSGIPGALGYFRKSKIPFEEGLVKNRYVGRTFIKPDQNEREIGVKLKLNPLTSVVKGKSIVLIDDSIVRGTTSKRIIDSLKKAGAKEVHLRITSPPVKYSCFFGIDTPRRSQLIASKKSIEDIKEEIGADSLKFLSLEGLFEAADFKNIFCMACFDGKYPMKPMDKEE
ncbi:amidophosphoribosyltransferase [Tepidibacter thalassicus]|uniref:Amidophosphoribosyltransferase n=1 Tax=Tepidibacter thalassicus DSM 15285 TaxID=1123350 RepID=A0A1M5SSA4_9FIRM|nr:amidophosphoribosyltransferase [Tepidibacter thalassicus]SHH41386.1 amidophosphoribosyltransferase [Tepidibacter thalassicus DSM 15285]